MSKMFKKMSKSAERYKYLIMIAVVVGALLVAANTQFQAGYVYDNGFTSPVLGYEEGIQLGAGQGTTLTWIYEGDLNEDGYTVYDMFVKVNQDNWISTGNVSISGNLIDYYVDGSLYEIDDVVQMKLIVYNTITIDKVYDDFTIYIIDPNASSITTTTPTGPTGDDSLIGENEIFFINMIILFSVVLGAMFVFSMIRRKMK